MEKTLVRGRVRTRIMSTEDLKRERKKLLKSVGLTERQLRHRESARKLSDRQRVVLGDLDDLKWLMV